MNTRATRPKLHNDNEEETSSRKSFHTCKLIDESMWAKLKANRKEYFSVKPFE